MRCKRGCGIVIVHGQAPARRAPLAYRDATRHRPQCELVGLASLLSALTWGAAEAGSASMTRLLRGRQNSLCCDGFAPIDRAVISRQGMAPLSRSRIISWQNPGSVPSGYARI